MRWLYKFCPKVRFFYEKFQVDTLNVLDWLVYFLNSIEHTLQSCIQQERLSDQELLFQGTDSD
jgi:hypothetical protein